MSGTNMQFSVYKSSKQSLPTASAWVTIEWDYGREWEKLKTERWEWKMVKKMLYNCRWRSLHNHKYFIIKLGVAILLVGLAFWLLYTRSTEFSPISDTPFLDNAQISPPPVSPLISKENTVGFPPKGQLFLLSNSLYFP